jgi:hypothetical protein
MMADEMNNDAYCPDCGKHTLRLIELTEEDSTGEFKEVRTCDNPDCDCLVYIVRNNK